MDLNINGLIVIIVFYLLIFLVGLWAWYKRRKYDADTGDAMLAGRDIGPCIGFMTLTATWVGGGYINGSAEAIYSQGLLWCQAPFGYAISLTFGGLFFAKKMRDAGYVTMLDPLQERFGQRWGSFLFLPALFGEVLWSASILTALGTTLSVMVSIDSKLSIILSTIIAVSYTLFGGLAAVAYTDVVQMVCILVGLTLSIPYAISHDAVGSIAETDWTGSIDQGSYEWGLWSDYYILLIFGGIPWQVYFQRVLSARTSKQAQILSIAASFGCIIMVVPACIIGAIAKATDWEATGFNRTISEEENPLVLPLVIQYLTPTWVRYAGLGAVSAAVMSSADSSILSSSSMFARNLYQNVFRPNSSEKETMIAMRIAVVFVASISCVIAIYGNSVYDLFHLCGDLVYVMLFPQLTMAVHFPSYVNVCGSIVGYFAGLTLRLLGGEKVLGIDALIKFPWYDEETGLQLFPFRTVAMVFTFVCLIVFSWIGKCFSIDKKILSIIERRNKNNCFISGIDNKAIDIGQEGNIGKNYRHYPDLSSGFEESNINKSQYNEPNDYEMKIK